MASKIDNMRHASSQLPNRPPPLAALPLQAMDYWISVWQRSVIFLDVLRQRGNRYLENCDANVPAVLKFKFEVILRGDRLERPVNYVLVRIVPPEDATIDPRLRPFIVFDPRAGHGPGIGGMKSDSQIGVALAAGHPSYFVGFLTEPVRGQTVQDVCGAHAAFVRKVSDLHPSAEGKPCLIANCQAGWQVMMMVAVNPGLAGPVLLAGSPLSYWNGVRGKDPMRYLGGLWGGSWTTSLMSDLGNGRFDGANLVANFEFLDPANTYWNKPYNVHSKIDTEPARFLEFESWWGSPILLEGEEMRYIADELFIGNRLTAGTLRDANKVRIDLRTITSPIIVFCSEGDNITPPQQALGWILDLYDSIEDIVAAGQTIVYSLNPTIGHLGIFVSAKVAKKEHDEFVRSMDLIDILPAGLYEAVISDIDPKMAHQELISGSHLIRFEPRSLDHIRALGLNSPDEDARFETVARLSDIGEGFYNRFFRPFVRPWVSEQSAELLRQIHPNRMRFLLFSDKSPFMALVKRAAEGARDHRWSSSGGIFAAAEHQMSDRIVTALDAYRDMRDRTIERLFIAFYGSPLVQAAAGLYGGATSREPIARDLTHALSQAKATADLAEENVRGSLGEALVRSLLYVGSGRKTVGVDERAFAVLRAFRKQQPESERMALAQFKALVRKQHRLLQLDEEAAVEAIPHLLGGIPDEQRSTALSLIHRVIEAGGDISTEVESRLARIESLIAGASDTAVLRKSAEPPEMPTTHAIAVRPKRAKAESARKH